MRALSTATAALLLAGCAGGMRETTTLSAPAPASTTQAMDCVRDQLEDMNYQIAGGAGMSGSVTGVRRNEPRWYLRMVGHSDTADQLNVSLEGGQLVVTALSTDPQEPSGTPTVGPTMNTGTASDAARQDARALLARCARQ